MRVQLIRSCAALATLRNEWDGLARPAASPLLEHDWFISCAEAFHGSDDLRVITVWDGDTLVAAAPLVSEKTSSGPRLTLLGASRLYEPSGWLFTSEDALLTLVTETRRARLPLLVQRVPAGSPLCNAVARVNRGRAVTFIRESSPALGIATRGDWNSYYRGLSTRITSNLPRVRRKAERSMGALEIDFSVPAPDDVHALLQTFSDIEGSGWKGRRGSALAQRADLRRFFDLYCRRAAERGRLRVATLRFGREIAAMELAVDAYERHWQLKIGYRDDLAAFYPGLHLTLASVQSAFERGLEAYEFLGCAEDWERSFRPETRAYRLVAAYPFSVQGFVGAWRDLVDVARRRTHAAPRITEAVA